MKTVTGTLTTSVLGTVAIFSLALTGFDLVTAYAGGLVIYVAMFGSLIYGEVARIRAALERNQDDDYPDPVSLLRAEGNRRS